MSFSTYLRRSVWELCFVTLAAACVGTCFSEGFYIPAEFEGRFLPALLICLALNVIAFAFAYSRKSAAAGIVVLALTAAGAAIALHRGAGGGALYAAAICAVDLSLFFAARLRAGAILALPLGVLVITGEMLFQYGSHPALLIVFLLSSGCLILNRIYHTNMLKNSTRAPAHSAYALLSISVCALAALLAAGVYFMAVKPLSPPSYEMSLKIELQKLPVMEKLGISSHIHLPDPDKKTSDLAGDEMLSDMNGENGDNPVEVKAPETPDNTGDSTKLPLSSIPADAISYLTRDYAWIYITCAVALAAALTVVGRLAARRIRLQRILKSSVSNQVEELYGCAIRAMERCRLPAIGSSSPREYCRSFDAKIKHFIGGRVDFSELTAVFERSFYGRIDPSRDELAGFIELYKCLPAVCLKNLGPFRYAAVFFRV